MQPAYGKYAHFYVLNDKAILPQDMLDKTFFIVHSERDWKFFVNLWEAFQILRKERPRVILSTGAGPVVPFAIIGRLFFDTKVVYVETITSVQTASLTGKIMSRLAHRFFYQWKSLSRLFPKGEWGGPLI